MVDLLLRPLTTKTSSPSLSEIRRGQQQREHPYLRETPDDYDDIDDPGLAFSGAENTAYYLATFDFNTPDMIDNTVFTFNTAFSGALHSEENSFHSIGTTVKARVGDHLELMLGYDIKLGDTEKASLFDYPGYIPDRDAVSLGITWYFM